MPISASAQSYSNFNQGSMNSTTTTEQTITESIEIEIYGAAYSEYAGHNITPSAAIGASGTTYTMNSGAENWQYETTTRAAGLIEKHVIDRTIDMESTTTSLSVFSQ